MQISTSRGDRRIRMHISVEIGDSGAAAMKKRIGQLDLTDMTEAVFNPRDVSYIGSAGLGKLLLLYKKLTQGNVVMKVESPLDMVREILFELKLDSLVPIV